MFAQQLPWLSISPYLAWLVTWTGVASRLQIQPALVTSLSLLIHVPSNPCRPALGSQPTLILFLACFSFPPTGSCSALRPNGNHTLLPRLSAIFCESTIAVVPTHPCGSRPWKPLACWCPGQTCLSVSFPSSQINHPSFPTQA